MTIFLWIIIVLIGTSSIGKLIHLAKESGDRETPRGMDAANVVIGASLIVWAAILLTL